jgi:two-component system chemotaxis response regulator CheY
MNRQLILVIDDDAAYRTALEEALEETEDYVVKSATDGKVGLETLNRLGSRVGMAVCDIEMPGMNGLDFVRAAESAGVDVPLLMATSKVGMRDEFTLKTSPLVRYFLPKPFDLDHLLKLLPPIVRHDAVAERAPLILLAEEVGEVRADMERDLEQRGCVVKSASERVEALAAIRRLSSSLDLVLFAFEMLGGNHETRMEFFHLVTQAARHVPILLMFTRDEFKDFAQERAGTVVEDYLVKPFDGDMLWRTVSKHLED